MDGRAFCGLDWLCGGGYCDFLRDKLVVEHIDSKPSGYFQLLLQFEFVARYVEYILLISGHLPKLHPAEFPRSYVDPTRTPLVDTTSAPTCTDRDR
jgi:hypothetical protein